MPKAVPRARQFLDLSSNNPKLNVGAYQKAGYKYAQLKTSQGNFYTWYEGAITAQECHAAGIHVGHYHWNVEGMNGIAQADYFVNAVKGRLGKKPTPGVWPPDGDYIMDDLERGSTDAVWPGDAARATELRDFNTRVMELLPGYPLYTYTGNWYMYNNPALIAESRKWLIWMSDYSNIEALPNPYDFEYAGWQDSDKQWFAGMSEPVDHNIWLPEPNMKDFQGMPTFTEKAMLKVARAVTRHGLQAVLSGTDVGHFTHKAYPKMVPGRNKGVLDRLAQLETELAELKGNHTPKKAV